jgi:hypothetical protein
MKEQLISFETAKLAKEKGFDIETMDTFRLWYDETLDYLGGFQNWNDPEWGLPNEEFYSRPTQSLLQKWLREKHGIHVQAMYALHRNIKGYFFGIPELPEAENNLVYDTWEAALEPGLQEALKTLNV